MGLPPALLSLPELELRLDFTNSESSTSGVVIGKADVVISVASAPESLGACGRVRVGAGLADFEPDDEG
jgi:hypothetical protein